MNASFLVMLLSVATFAGELWAIGNGDAGPLNDDLPGDGVPVAPAPAAILEVFWQAPGFDPRDHIDDYITLIVIDPGPLFDGQVRAPATVVTYRQIIWWDEEINIRTDPRLFDISYPAECWLDQHGRLHVDARQTPITTIDGPMGGYDPRLGRAGWYPDSFLFGVDAEVRIKDTSLDHAPHQGRLNRYVVPGSSDYQMLRATAQSMVRNAW